MLLMMVMLMMMLLVMMLRVSSSSLPRQSRTVFPLHLLFLPVFRLLYLFSLLLLIVLPHLHSLPIAAYLEYRSCRGRWRSKQ